MTYTSYDRIGVDYDATRKADPYLSVRFFQLLGLKPGAHVLDVGCGTGNYATSLEEQGLQVTGLDPSEKMLERARSKSRSINWIEGVVETLPMANASFDGALASLTTHHWTDLTMGFRELYRVLRPGSRLVLFTSTPEQMERYWLAHYFPIMMARSCSVMPTAITTVDALQAAGFSSVQQEPYEVRQDLQDLFLYAAKEDPSRYLDPMFRKGISSFAALVEDHEVQDGLVQLEKDIASGAWRVVRNNYMHEKGDYLFIVARRN